jgi:hypothetical protein
LKDLSIMVDADKLLVIMKDGAIYKNEAARASHQHPMAAE